MLALKNPSPVVCTLLIPSRPRTREKKREGARAWNGISAIFMIKNSSPTFYVFSRVSRFVLSKIKGEKQKREREREREREKKEKKKRSRELLEDVWWCVKRSRREKGNCPTKGEHSNKSVECLSSLHQRLGQWLSDRPRLPGADCRKKGRETGPRVSQRAD
ncbi:hypothetical protein ANTRET_LOCUS1729 [Anthophora retusa]